ncbi:MAG TPA: 3-methyl-2-oxobutanoate hydroxymethyltransferase, partial [Bacteroidetes bacterium]|nr:3-methyl-2-oxobutanoate hydroxymethyltransferase [Bacteroidota bacterium]
EERQALVDDALALDEAGVFALVLEKVPSDLAGEITRRVRVPTIGIGAGPQCDGQILVTHDMLGLFERFKPKFVRRYANLAAEIRKAVEAYSEDVQQGRFPGPDESY